MCCAEWVSREMTGDGVREVRDEEARSSELCRPFRASGFSLSFFLSSEVHLMGNTMCYRCTIW